MSSPTLSRSIFLSLRSPSHPYYTIIDLPLFSSTSFGDLAINNCQSSALKLWSSATIALSALLSVGKNPWSIAIAFCLTRLSRETVNLFFLPLTNPSFRSKVGQ
ncbi:hypothetical protein AAHA92_22339 [Salvia divinorum]|uniref:Uncharacterized protein n=1 Tax=Salvia divinorum TaxID=28513 RepID=A0ABD1GRB0_SALDI